MLQRKGIFMKQSHSSPIEKKPDRRVSRTIRNINSAFLSLLKEKPLSAINITELCVLADINRKTFYTYFDSVSAVLYDIENQIINEFSQRIDTQKNRDIPLTVSDIFLCIGELLRNNREFIHQLVQVNALESLEKKVRQAIKQTIKDTIENETILQNDYADLTLEYVVSGAVSMYIEWFTDANNLPLVSLIELTSRLVQTNVDFLTSDNDILSN